MKKLLVLVLVAMAVSLVPLMAQSAVEDNGLQRSEIIRSPSNQYPVRLDVVKVFIHAQGYRIVYRKGPVSFSEAYIPSTWFVPGGKAVLLPSNGPELPYAVAYFNEDQSFSHIKLYVHRSLTHESWGQMTGDPGERFASDTLTLDL